MNRDCKMIKKMIWPLLAVGWLLAAGSLLAQEVVILDIETLFKSQYKALISTPTDSNFAVLTSVDTTADTITSSEISTSKGGGDIYVVARVVADLGDSVNTKLQLGLYRGKGIVRSQGTDGYDWYDLLTFNDVGEGEYVLKNLSAVADKPFSRYKFRWVETGVQSNQYLQYVHHYRAGR